MKTPQNLGLVAYVVFLTSYILPAYDNASGFVCFGECWNMLLGRHTDAFSRSWFYYSGFAISSILFNGLVVALFAMKRHRKLRSVVSVVMFLHVFSWLVLHILEQPSQIAEMKIKIGYYVWLIAYALLVAAHLRKEPSELFGTVSLAHSGV